MTGQRKGKDSIPEIHLAISRVFALSSQVQPPHLPGPNLSVLCLSLSANFPERPFCVFCPASLSPHIPLRPRANANSPKSEVGGPSDLNLLDPSPSRPPRPERGPCSRFGQQGGPGCWRPPHTHARTHSVRATSCACTRTHPCADMYTHAEDTLESQASSGPH